MIRASIIHLPCSGTKESTQKERVTPALIVAKDSIIASPTFGQVTHSGEVVRDNVVSGFNICKRCHNVLVFYCHETDIFSEEMLQWHSNNPIAQLSQPVCLIMAHGRGHSSGKVWVERIDYR